MSIQKIEIQQLQRSNYDQLAEVMKAAYSNWGGTVWSEKSIKKLLNVFPEGQLVVLADDKVVGCALSIIVKYADFGDEHTYRQITGNYTFSTHNPNGNVLYGIEVFIHPDFRGMRLGRRLYDSRKELCEELNLKAVVLGGRIPNYHKYSSELSPREYIQKVRQSEIFDPVLSFQLSNDFHVKKVLKNYIPEDNESEEYATLLQWDNVFYTPNNRQAFRSKRNVRIGLIQWKMRLYDSLEELFQQAEYFIDAISSYKADFAVFPEFFNGPLMAQFEGMSEAEAIRAVAQYTTRISEKFSELAVVYNVNIIAGSMPLYDGTTLKNIGYLCHRNGEIEMYEKLHITPDEEKYWGLKGGDDLRVFDTDVGKIGILICYDVEFPENVRLLAKGGADLVVVPTALPKGWSGDFIANHMIAVRAFENQVFVAYINHSGSDELFEYAGLSRIAAPDGKLLTEAPVEGEALIITEIDPSAYVQSRAENTYLADLA